MDFDHLGFVVKDIEQSAANFEKNYGMKTVTSIIVDKTQKVKVQFLSFSIRDVFKNRVNRADWSGLSCQKFSRKRWRSTPYCFFCEKYG